MRPCRTLHRRHASSTSRPLLLCVRCRGRQPLLLHLLGHQLGAVAHLLRGELTPERQLALVASRRGGGKVGVSVEEEEPKGEEKTKGATAIVRADRGRCCDLPATALV